MRGLRKKTISNVLDSKVECDKNRRDKVKIGNERKARLKKLRKEKKNEGCTEE